MSKFKCPKCGTIFEEKIDKCPNCGVAFSFPEEKPVEAEVLYTDDQDELANNRKVLLAFIFSIIGLETTLFPFSIVALSMLGGARLPLRHPHRAFYYIAKPVSIVGLIVGILFWVIMIIVIIVTVSSATRLAA